MAAISDKLIVAIGRLKSLDYVAQTGVNLDSRRGAVIISNYTEGLKSQIAIETSAVKQVNGVEYAEVKTVPFKYGGVSCVADVVCSETLPSGSIGCRVTRTADNVVVFEVKPVAIVPNSGAVVIA